MMPVVEYQIPGGMNVPASRGSYERVWKPAAKVLLFTCEGCGRPAGHSVGAKINEALRTGDMSRAGRWYCGLVNGWPVCLVNKSTAARKDVPGKTTVRDALAQIGTTPPVKAVQPPVSQEAAFASTGDSIRRRVPDPNTAAGTQAPPVETDLFGAPL